MSRKILFLCLRFLFSLVRRQSNLTKLYYVQIELMCVWSRDFKRNWLSRGLNSLEFFPILLPLTVQVMILTESSLMSFNDVTMETFLPNYSHRRTYFFITLLNAPSMSLSNVCGRSMHGNCLQTFSNVFGIVGYCNLWIDSNTRTM